MLENLFEKTVGIYYFRNLNLFYNIFIIMKSLIRKILYEEFENKNPLTNREVLLFKYLNPKKKEVKTKNAKNKPIVIANQQIINFVIMKIGKKVPLFCY